MSPLTSFRLHPSRALPLLLLSLMAPALVAGCGEKKKDKTATQAAARVNDEELTVHQINLVLQQQRNLRPEQADAASRQILERLIDQSLAVQKAESLKLDRDPRVVQQIEAAKREIVARAYVEKIGEGAAKPTPEEIGAYYKSKPALFAERRIYSIQELAIEAKPDQIPLLRERLGAAKSITEFVDYLKANDYRFAANQAVRAAEQLPMNVLDAVSRMKDGQATVNQGPNGVLVVVLAGSRSQPVGDEQARPAIEQYLLNERKRKLVEDDVKTMRGAAKIEYLGKFAEGPRPGASGPAPAAPSAVEPASAAGSGAPLSPADISKGMGLK
jgi:EpsD family peptidyl-prolyl cis-trans isomerase